nr:MAG: glycogen debranching enzyme [Candidatus Nanosalinarum sp. J07AB56]
MDCFEPGQEASRTLISGPSTFVFRHVEGGFPSKWTGVWRPPYKVLDYLSYRVNGQWLTANNLKSVQTGTEDRRTHILDSLHVTEITAPRHDGITERLLIENNTTEPKAVTAAMELGVDIRHQSQDIGPKEYNTEYKANQLVFSKPEQSLTLESEGFSLEGSERMKEHFPGERQRALVPPKLRFNRTVQPKSSTEVKMYLRTDAPEDAARPAIDTAETGFSEAEEHAARELEKLCFSTRGRGVAAGLPWFQDYWTRDMLWAALGLLEAGAHRFVAGILENLARRGLPGRIGTDDDHPRDDTEPLFIVACDRLSRNANLSPRLQNSCEDAMTELEMNGGLAEHHPKGTWMDTERRRNAVEIQSLWLEAAEAMDDPRAAELRSGLESFVQDKAMYDTAERQRKTANAAVPLMFGQLNEETARPVLRDLNSELASEHGARTLSHLDPDYDPSGYHTGSSWGLTTWWLSAANLRYGMDTRGKALMRNFLHHQGRGVPGALPEAIDSDTGELVGCHSQAWSNAGLIHLCHRHLQDTGQREPRPRNKA